MSNSRGKSRTTNTAPKKRITAVTITVIVIVLFFIAALFINSKFMRRQVTAVEANGMKFSASEYQFFYVSAISEYTNYINNTFGDSGSAMLPDASKPFDTQTNPMTGQTWADYYYETAISSIQLFSGAYQEAMAAGFTVSDEDYAKIDSEIDMLSEQVSMYYGMTFAEFISSQFGASSGVTEDLYRELSKKQYLADRYSQSVNDARSYTEAQLEGHYAEHRDEYDIFKYRYFTVRSESLDRDTFDTDEEYEAADAAAIEAARALAASYVTSISNEQDFIEKAREYNETTYEKDTSTLNHTAGKDLTTTFADWAKDPSRTLGDLCAEPTNTDESSNRAFYVVFFVDRLNNKYPTVNIQLMLLSGQDISRDDYTDDEGVLNEFTYNAELDSSNSALEIKAKALFAEWEENGGTLDYLTEYYAANTSTTYGGLDEYSATISGSLYSNIYYSYTPDDAADAWMHDPARKEGDITVVEGTNNGTWFLMYFVGQDMDYCDYLADTALRTEDMNIWTAGFSSTAVKTGWGMKLL